MQLLLGAVWGQRVKHKLGSHHRRMQQVGRSLSLSGDPIPTWLLGTASPHPRCCRWIDHAESAMKSACSPLRGHMGEEKVLLASPLTLVFLPLSLLLCLLQGLFGAGAGCSIGRTPPPPHQGQQWGGTGTCLQPSCPKSSCGACERCLCPWKGLGTRWSLTSLPTPNPRPFCDSMTPQSSTRTWGPRAGATQPLQCPVPVPQPPLPSGLAMLQLGQYNHLSEVYGDTKHVHLPVPHSIHTHIHTHTDMLYIFILIYHRSSSHRRLSKSYYFAWS